MVDSIDGTVESFHGAQVTYDEVMNHNFGQLPQFLSIFSHLSVYLFQTF